MEHLRPESILDVVDFISTGLHDERVFEVMGGGTRRGFGEFVDADCVMDMSLLSGIESYQPEELILEVRAGTSLLELQSVLLERNQILAFEPVDYSHLFVPFSDGIESLGVATIGGAVLSNDSGSRRPFAGAGRDFLLGFSGVSGRGEAFKAGGKVVKNVTGFDLSKLIAGSYGTLAAVTSLILKTHPAPESQRSFACSCADISEARTLMKQAINASLPPSGAAYLPHSNEVILRFEGYPASLDSAAKKLTTITSEFSQKAEAQESQNIWRSISQAEIFSHQKCNPNDLLWRIYIPPQACPQLIEILTTLQIQFQYITDWGGALIWLNEICPDNKESQHLNIRSACQNVGGYAHLIRDPKNSNIPKFNPRPKNELNLIRKIKYNFDPKNILNPNRMGF